MPHKHGLAVHMPLTRAAILRLPAEGGIEAALISEMLAAAASAHASYEVFDRLLGDAERFSRDIRRYSGIFDPWYLDWAPFATPSRHVYPGQALLVSRVELASPGF